MTCRIDVGSIYPYLIYKYVSVRFCKIWFLSPYPKRIPLYSRLAMLSVYRFCNTEIRASEPACAWNVIAKRLNTATGACSNKGLPILTPGRQPMNTIHRGTLSSVSLLPASLTGSSAFSPVVGPDVFGFFSPAKSSTAIASWVAA